nr:MAG: replication initiator protein [Microvirus sp.]
MCLYPKLIKNKKYLPNKKNKGNPPTASDERTKLVPVGCGKCIECMKQKKRNWQIRMSEEIKEDKTGLFVTLTFSNEAFEKLRPDVKVTAKKLWENELATIAIRRFLERWRKKYKKSVKHWLVTELGHNGTERIHLHGIIFTDNKEDIEKIWQYGYVWIGEYVSIKTINYIVKYINKLDTQHKGYQPKVLCSKGIGKGYLKKTDANRNKYNGNETKEYYRSSSGHKINLPIYYRNHIYSEDERENLWIKKLDQNIRYVNGEKVNGDDENTYFSLLEHYREKNKRLGYGDDSEEWDVKEYKRKKAMLRQVKKIEEMIKYK